MTEFENNLKEVWFLDWKKKFDITDPRMDRKKLHSLIDILTLALCAIISGAESWVDVENYGKQKHEWLKKFLDLPNGIPSHDTIGRVFSMINPEQFQSCFVRWTKSLAGKIEGLISIDGKALRGSNNYGDSPVNIVGAWSTENKIVLGQVKTDQKSNEITAIPELIDSIDVSGSIVSIDAAGCQKKIVEKIINGGADYLIALKGNQGTLRTEVEWFLSGIKDMNVHGKNLDYFEASEKNHGRLEKRCCLVSTDTQLLPTTHNWKELNSVIMIESQRIVNGHSATEKRFYISSAKLLAKEFNEKIRLFAQKCV